MHFLSIPLCYLPSTSWDQNCDLLMNTCFSCIVTLQLDAVSFLFNLNSLLLVTFVGGFSKYITLYNCFLLPLELMETYFAFYGI